MKTITLLITIGLLVSAGPSEAETMPLEDSIRFRVVAFNVQVSRKATAEEIGTALLPYTPDVVCFSEAPGGDWTRNAAAVLGLEHVVVGRYTTAGHDDKYKTIASRTPLHDVEEVLMADTLHTATRAVTRIGDRDISIYSIHFPKGWRDQAHIDETTGKVTAFVDYLKARQANEIAIVAGDFNFVPTNADSLDPYHEMFIDIGLDVSWKDLEIDITKRNTSRIGRPDEERFGRVIDHIMYDPTRVKAVDGDIIELEKPLSDHKPVWAELEIR